MTIEVLYSQIAKPERLDHFLPLYATTASSLAALAIAIMLTIVVMHRRIAYRWFFLAALFYFACSSIRNTTVAHDLYFSRFPKNEQYIRALASSAEIVLAVCLAFALGSIIRSAKQIYEEAQQRALVDADVEVDSAMKRDNIILITQEIHKEADEALKRRMASVGA